MIDLPTYLKQEEASFLKRKEKRKELYETYVNDILNDSLSKEERSNIISNLINYVVYWRDEGYEFKRDSLIQTYQECQVIWTGITKEFECEWIGEDRLAVDINCKSLSFFCIMLARIYDLHSGMFTFSSSFTEHEAYTKSGHLIHISFTPDGRGLIKFNLFEKEPSVYD